ncbi:MAG: sugar transferase [Bacteroidales bacterium]|nr:sugar transferase [Bacteroidales bacterium]
MEKALRLVYIGSSTETVNLLAADRQLSVTVQGNILAAENYLKSGQIPDAILCEMTLSGGDGIQMHEWVRQRADLNPVSFMLVTHEFKEDLYREAFKRRMDDYFVIPLQQPESMAGRIEYLRDYRQKIATVEPELEKEITYHMPLSKRIFDIALAGGALVALSPLLLIVMIAIRLESKGKVYYTSRRVGREPFDFYKLRSMRVGADADLAKLAKDKNQYASVSEKSEIDFEIPCEECIKLPKGKFCSPIIHIGSHSICENSYKIQQHEIDKSKSAFIKIVNDPRITRVGKIIRNTSIDELPQLINVIKGDMSIVGNRPLPVYEAEQITKGDMSRRFLAPAGITGLWQVELRGKGGDMSEDERKRLDNVYSDHFIGNNYSFWYDFKLILRTFKALFQKDTV